MINFLAVFLGGGLGATLRYLINCLSENCHIFSIVPATFLINVVGSFLIGLFAAIVLNKSGIPQHYNLFFICGLCGGFTTFSTFSLELLNYLQNHLYIQACCYVCASVIICLLGTFAGGIIGKYII